MRRLLSKPAGSEPRAARNEVRQASIDAAVGLLRDRMKFAELAEVLGVSRPFVHARLTADTSRLLWVGKGWQVPYPVAVEFITTTLSTVRTRPAVPIAQAS